MSLSLALARKLQLSILLGGGGGSIYNGNTLITPLTKALKFYAICGTKDQGLTILMVYKTLFYVSYLLRYRLLKQAHIYYSKLDKAQTFIFVCRRSCLSDTKHFMINV